MIECLTKEQLARFLELHQVGAIPTDMMVYIIRAATRAERDLVTERVWRDESGVLHWREA